MEVIGNALELRAFDRMEEDIRLIGYFKSEDSERECAGAVDTNMIRTLLDGSATELSVAHLNPLIFLDLQIHFYHYCTPSCHCLVQSHMLWKS